MQKSKSYHESFARFFEAPTRSGLRELLQTNPGELRSCDFKELWPEATDLSKHILGLGNSGGGALVIGVAEATDGTLESVGIETLRDKADITNDIKNYLPGFLLGAVDVVDFSFDESEYPKLVGKRFQVLFVEDDPAHLPFLASRDGAGVRRNAIYVRREGMTEEASSDELQEVINRRIATGHSTQRELDLAFHMEQLKVLYTFLAKQNVSILDAFTRLALTGIGTPNPRYPGEDFEGFVLRMIKEKKSRIEEELDLLRPSG